MVEASIALQGKSVDTATPIRQMQADDNNNELATQQILKQHLDNMGERDKQRLQSSIIGASQLKTYLDKGDVEGAHDFLVQRQAALHQRMGAGENVDTQETDYALDKLRKGDIQGLQNDVHSLIAAGQAYGMVGGTGQPASIQEWQYYNSLSPQDQQRWLQQKRANQLANLGGETKIIGPDGKPVSTYEHTLKPEDQPKNAEAKANAEAQGKANGENTANATNTIGKMGGLMTSLDNLKTSSAAAPSGVIEGLGAQVANKTGIGGQSANAQGDFQVKRAAAENEIRAAFRVVGSGSQSDADAKPFIDMLPTADDADSVKAAKVQAAMDAVKAKVANLAQQRGLADPFTGAGAAPVAGAAQPGKGVTVTNGQETYTIDPADLPAAQAEGFKQVQ